MATDVPSSSALRPSRIAGANSSRNYRHLVQRSRLLCYAVACGGARFMPDYRHSAPRGTSDYVMPVEGVTILHLHIDRTRTCARHIKAPKAKPYREYSKDEIVCKRKQAGIIP